MSYPIVISILLTFEQPLIIFNYEEISRYAQLSPHVDTIIKRALSIGLLI